MLNLLIIIIIKKIVQPMSATQPNLIHADWVGLDRCEVLG